jgi:acyl dehydratase
MARAAGQPSPFLHGLCTLGILGRAATERGERLTSLSARFTRPVFPGEALDIEAWWADDGAGATARVSVGGELVRGPAGAAFAPAAT